MPFHAHAPRCAAIAAAWLWSASAHAASDPTGIWFDHNDRGAVEIKECASGNGLCGYVVHVNDPAKAKNCGMQILGEVTPGGGGWIYSPERKRKYDVSLKRLSEGKLRVVGNAGSRFFSRTFTWNRAPDDIVRCGETTAAAPVNKGQAESKQAAASAAPVARTTAPDRVATTGSIALVANAKALAVTQPAAAAANASSKNISTKPASESTKPAEASDTGAGLSEDGSKRKCKYRIPYIGRTISARCRS